MAAGFEPKRFAGGCAAGVVDPPNEKAGGLDSVVDVPPKAAPGAGVVLVAAGAEPWLWSGRVSSLPSYILCVPNENVGLLPDDPNENPLPPPNDMVMSGLHAKWAVVTGAHGWRSVFVASRDVFAWRAYSHQAYPRRNGRRCNDAATPCDSHEAIRCFVSSRCCTR